MSIFDSAKTVKVHGKLIDEMLGTSPNNPDVYREFIASKAPEGVDIESEIAAIGTEEFISKSMTVFPKDENGTPCIKAYQILGMLKEGMGACRKIHGSECSKVKAYKKVLDTLVFISPDMIPFKLPEGEFICECTRPLRAQTMQGERVSLACSESVPAGSEFDFEITYLSSDIQPAVEEVLEYARLHGLGQWRNSGKGRTEFTLQG